MDNQTSNHQSINAGDPNLITQVSNTIDGGQSIQNAPSSIQPAPFSYKIDNPSVVARSLATILFSEQFSDVILKCGVEDTSHGAGTGEVKEVQEGTEKSICNQSTTATKLPVVTKIFAHRQILAASSEVFQTMLYGPFVEGSMREIVIPNIDGQIMKLLVQFIYTGQVTMDSASQIVPLIHAADQYSVHGAKEEFVKAAQIFMQKANKSQIVYVIKLIQDALLMDLPHIAKLGFEYIDLHTVDVLESDNLFEMDASILKLILKRDTLHDGLEEIQLYLACLRWARGQGTLDYTDEKQFKLSLDELNPQIVSDLKDILKNIRFPLIPTETLVKKIHPQNLIDAEDLFIATAYQAAPDCFRTDNSHKFRHRNGSELPWTWSEELHGQHIILSNNLMTVHGCHYDWEKIIGNVTWRSGIHKYDIQIDLNMLASSNSWQIIVGVAQVPAGLNPSQVRQSINLSNHLGSTPKEWGMMCLSGQKIHKNMVEQYTTCSKKGDVIGLQVDLNSGFLEFTRNGCSLGVAFENVKGPISPCISLLKGQKITLINSLNKKLPMGLPGGVSGDNTQIILQQQNQSQNSQLLFQNTSLRSQNQFSGGSGVDGPHQFEGGDQILQQQQMSQNYFASSQQHFGQRPHPQSQRFNSLMSYRQIDPQIQQQFQQQIPNHYICDILHQQPLMMRQTSQIVKNGHSIHNTSPRHSNEPHISQNTLNQNHQSNSHCSSSPFVSRHNPGGSISPIQQFVNGQKLQERMQANRQSNRVGTQQSDQQIQATSFNTNRSSNAVTNHRPQSFQDPNSLTNFGSILIEQTQSSLAQGILQGTESQQRTSANFLSARDNVSVGEQQPNNNSLVPQLVQYEEEKEQSNQATQHHIISQQNVQSQRTVPSDIAALYPQNNQHRYLKEILKQKQKTGGIGSSTARGHGAGFAGSLKKKNLSSVRLPNDQNNQLNINQNSNLEINQRTNFKIQNEQQNSSNTQINQIQQIQNQNYTHQQEVGQSYNEQEDQQSQSSSATLDSNESIHRSQPLRPLAQGTAAELTENAFSLQRGHGGAYSHHSENDGDVDDNSRSTHRRRSSDGNIDQERSDLYSRDEEEEEDEDSRDSGADNIQENERASYLVHKQSGLKDGNILIIQNNLIKRGQNVSNSKQIQQVQTQANQTILPSLSTNVGLQGAATGFNSSTKQTNNSNFNINALVNNRNSIPVDSLPDLHQPKSNVQVLNQETKFKNTNQQYSSGKKQNKLDQQQKASTKMPKIQRGCLSTSYSQYLSLSAENSIDRMKFKKGSKPNKDRQLVLEAISSTQIKDSRSIINNNIIGDANNFNEMCKSFSSADQAHFFNDQRQNQNLVGGFDELDGEFKQEIERKSSRNITVQSNQGDRHITENDDKYNIISIRDSNLETPALCQSVDTIKFGSDLHNQISSFQNSNKNNQLTPLNQRGRDGRSGLVGQPNGGVFLGSRQGSRGISHEDDQRENEEIQYIKIQQKNLTQTQFFQPSQITNHQSDLDNFAQSFDGVRIREQNKTASSNCDQADSIKILQSNLNNIKDLQSSKKNPPANHTDLSTHSAQKKSYDMSSQLSKSIGMQALGSENFGVPISTSQRQQAVNANSSGHISGTITGLSQIIAHCPSPNLPVSNLIPQNIKQKVQKKKQQSKNNQTQSMQQTSTAAGFVTSLSSKRSSGCVLSLSAAASGHKIGTKNMISQRESKNTLTKSKKKGKRTNLEEEQRKRDEVLRELEVLNEECQTEEVLGWRSTHFPDTGTLEPFTTTGHPKPKADDLGQAHQRNQEDYEDDDASDQI